MTAARLLARLRKACLALPEAHEVEAWGAPTFRVRNRIFAMYAAPENHHGRERASVWVKAKHVTQDLLMRADPDRYFAPPYVGPKGWVGAHLDNAEWDALRDLLHDAYRMIAPKRVAARLDAD